MANNESEQPRSEPEIIPPERAVDDDMGRAARLWSFRDGGEYHRIYVARIGPFGIFLIALAAAVLSILILLFVVGAFLIWIPIVGLLVAAAILSSLLRNVFHRPS